MVLVWGCHFISGIYVSGLKSVHLIAFFLIPEMTFISILFHRLLTYNTVNHPVFPSRGLKTSIRVIQTGTPFGGNIQLREYRLQYQQFWAMNQDNTLILMAKGRFGLLQEQGGSPIPSEDRYRIGGIDSSTGTLLLQDSRTYGPAAAS
jgi:Outer membrane protein/protective antigen OMA87